MNDVPLWIYLLTAFGVAAFGVGGVMLSNRNHSQQIEKQLAFERDRMAAEREAEHTRWLREKRLTAYEEFLRLIGQMEYHSGRVLTMNTVPDLALADQMQEAQDAFLMWASDDVASITREALLSIARLSKALIQFVGDKRGSTRHKGMEALSALEEKRSEVRIAMQKDLGITL